MKVLKHVWMKVTEDKYEFPLAIADTAEELAEMVGVKVGSLYGIMYKARTRGWNCIYKYVEYWEGDEDED